MIGKKRYIINRIKTFLHKISGKIYGHIYSRGWSRKVILNIINTDIDKFKVRELPMKRKNGKRIIRYLFTKKEPDYEME